MTVKRGFAGISPKSHSDIVHRARDLMTADRATRDILLDRSEPMAPKLIQAKRGLRDLFRKKTDPFALTPAKFDTWAAEIAAYHPSRHDLWRETPDVPRDQTSLDLPGVAMAAEKWEPS